MPARIAILGAGPTGLEAALYARFLGYDVDVFERGRVAERLLQLGDEPLGVPWRLVPSPLGLAALEAQNPDWRAPADDAVVTCAQAVERYYLPLSKSDLLADSVRTDSSVISVGRRQPESEELDSDDRPDPPFHVLLRGAGGERQIATADAVLDCTGRNQPNLEYEPTLGQVEQSQAANGRFLRAGPDFYILGEKSCSTDATISFTVAQAQIRDVFKVVGDRDSLDLYATVRPLR